MEEKQKEDKKSFSYKFIKAQDSFFAGKWSFVTFITIVLIFALLQVLLFGLGVISVESTTNINSWQAWLYMVISPIGAILSLIGYVYTVRVDKKFLIPTFVGQAIGLISSFLSGMIWTGFIALPILAVGIWRALIIKKQGPGYKLNNKLVYSVGLGIIGAATLIGVIMAAVPAIGDSFWWKHTPTTETWWYRELDVISSTFATIGALFLVTKNKGAFYMFLVCNVLFITLFIVSSAWMNALQILVFLICNSFAVAAWTYKEKQKDF